MLNTKKDLAGLKYVYYINFLLREKMYFTMSLAMSIFLSNRFCYDET